MLEALELPAQQHAFGDRPYICRTRLPVEERLLSDHASCTNARKRGHAETVKARDADFERAFGDKVERAIVNRIAAMHGGKVKLLAREGAGLRARVELPAHAYRSES